MIPSERSGNVALDDEPDRLKVIGQPVIFDFHLLFGSDL